MSAARLQPCELCGRPTTETAAYVPTDDKCERVFMPGVMTFPLCHNCQVEVKTGTPRAQCFLNDLRNLATAGLGASS